MNPLKETFTVDCVESDSIEEEIDQVKKELVEIQNEAGVEASISFYLDPSGVANMVFTSSDQDNFEIPRDGFKGGTRTKYLLRKLEDLVYARKHGSFPEEVPGYSLMNEEPTSSEKAFGTIVEV